MLRLSRGFPRCLVHDGTPYGNGRPIDRIIRGGHGARQDDPEALALVERWAGVARGEVAGEGATREASACQELRSALRLGAGSSKAKSIVPPKLWRGGKLNNSVRRPRSGRTMMQEEDHLVVLQIVPCSQSLMVAGLRREVRVHHD
jgi:hypothetical protein